ncbi:MAG: xylose isomerase, partial [Pseudomonadota bacterium]|nr:xylose isomerase [Pseudomonadota bacterium]
DLNRGDNLLGWDTDQFAMNVPELTLALYEFLRAGGFTTGGMNFDAKIRRQSIEPDDLLHGQIASMDATARALLNAAAMIEDGGLQRFVDERYSGWDGELGRAILAGERSLDDLAAYVEERGLEPQPKSGRQEMLENLANRFS